MTGLDFLGSTAWAMPSADLQAMIAIANREGDLSPEALQAYRSASLQRAERAGVRDGVAIIGINGPLFRKANLFTSMSGATSYEQVRRDLQVALDDPSVTAILLDIDSPGGEAHGCGELADAIRAATARKPVHAYAGGLCASGALWIAVAASRVTIDAATLVGSIGIVMSMSDDSAADERRGIKRIEIVSSQSPGKRPDPATDEGHARLQATVDSLAAVFVKAVAGFRGVTDATVISKFGGGGVLVGAQAVKVGLVDGIGSFEGALSALRDAPRQQRISAAVDRALSAARSDAAEQQLDRDQELAAIEDVGEHAGRDRQEEDRQRRCRLDQRHGGRRTGEVGHQPGAGDVAHERADIADDRRRPEHGEDLLAQRCEARGRFGAHRAALFRRPRSSSATRMKPPIRPRCSKKLFVAIIRP